jgi:hypothetical protein
VHSDLAARVSKYATSTPARWPDRSIGRYTVISCESAWAVTGQYRDRDRAGTGQNIAKRVTIIGARIGGLYLVAELGIPD